MWRQPIGVEARPLGQQSCEPNLIADTIKMYFEIHMKPIDMPMIRKYYPEWKDRLVPLPKCYKTQVFATFFLGNMTNQQWSTLEASLRSLVQRIIISSISYNCSIYH